MYEPQGPFATKPQAGFARILQPSLPDDVARGPIHGQPCGGIYTETGAPFSSYMPRAQALAWARDLAETYGRAYRVVE